MKRVGWIALAVGTAVLAAGGIGWYVFLRHPESWERPNTALHEAIARGDTDGLRTLLDQGQNPNAVDKHGFTPLCWVARGADVQTARILIAHGARADHVALACAVGSRSWPMIELLLAHGAPPGGSALVAAVETGDPRMVEYLIGRGADINARGLLLHQSYALENPEREGSPPLLVAVVRRDSAMVALLLRHGADPAGIDRSGISAAEMARRVEDPHILALFAGRTGGGRSAGSASAPSTRGVP